MSRQTRKPPDFLKVSLKRRAAILREKRAHADLKPRIDKKPTSAADNPFSIFSEWANEADEKAYANF